VCKCTQVKYAVTSQPITANEADNEADVKEIQSPSVDKLQHSLPRHWTSVDDAEVAAVAAAHIVYTMCNACCA